MNRPIPTRWPDMEAWTIAYLSPLLGGVPVTNILPAISGAHQAVVVRATLQQRVTPISRYCRLGLQAWSVGEDGTADLGGARDLGALVGELLELAPVDAAPLLVAEVESGPYRVMDPVSKVEYSSLGVLAEIRSL